MPQPANARRDRPTVSDVEGATPYTYSIQTGVAGKEAAQPTGPDPLTIFGGDAAAARLEAIRTGGWRRAGGLGSAPSTIHRWVSAGYVAIWSSERAGRGRPAPRPMERTGRGSDTRDPTLTPLHCPSRLQPGAQKTAGRVADQGVRATSALSRRVSACGAEFSDEAATIHKLLAQAKQNRPAFSLGRVSARAIRTGGVWTPTAWGNTDAGLSVATSAVTLGPKITPNCGNGYNDRAGWLLAIPWRQ